MTTQKFGILYSLSHRGESINFNRKGKELVEVQPRKIV